MLSIAVPSLLSRPAKDLLRRQLGRHLVAEAWWKVRFAAQRRAARQREDAEVARLAPGLTRLPAARVVVVVATYRRPEGLRAAVESVLSQTVRDLVVVVVDDGGGQTETLPTDPRVTLLPLSGNMASCGLARNVGIRLSRSRYLAFLDDDNTWRPDHLQQALTGLDGGARLAYTSVQRRLPDGSPFDVLDRDFSRKAHRDDSWVDSNAIVVRRGPDALFSGWSRPLWLHPKEDWELVHRLSRHHEVVHVPAITVDYQVNPESYFTDWAATAAVGERG